MRQIVTLFLWRTSGKHFSQVVYRKLEVISLNLDSNVSAFLDIIVASNNSNANERLIRLRRRTDALQDRFNEWTSG
jgi:hypothetical protein